MYRKHVWFIALACICCMLIGFTLLSMQQATQQTARQAEMEQEIAALLAFISTANHTQPELALSSNPYRYSKDNLHFDRIVAYGEPMLPLLIKRIKTSTSNGLDTYLLAIAAETIAADNHAYKPFDWSTGKQFAKRYEQQ